MALLPDVFVPEDAEDNPYEPIEAGWYTAEIISSGLKDTKDKTGKYIALKFVVLEHEKYEGRFIYTNLNIQNKSDQAVLIARADLKSICKAVRHSGELEDTEDLHNIPMQIKVSIKPETAQWPARNEIKKYRADS